MQRVLVLWCSVCRCCDAACAGAVMKRVQVLWCSVCRCCAVACAVAVMQRVQVLWCSVCRCCDVACAGVMMQRLLWCFYPQRGYKAKSLDLVSVLDWLKIKCQKQRTWDGAVFITSKMIFRSHSYYVNCLLEHDREYNFLAMAYPNQFPCSTQDRADLCRLEGNWWPDNCSCRQFSRCDWRDIKTLVPCTVQYWLQTIICA